tara:strand:- start:417 stop:680 length:264 start_codon:yes stop_codon:yes gene_type:complete
LKNFFNISDLKSNQINNLLETPISTRLEKFSDSSIYIIIVCFTSTKDWGVYLQIKEDLALEIKKNVEKIGLSFAYPSQSIYIEKSPN